MRPALFAFIFLSIAAAPALAAGKKPDTARIEQITGVKGTYNEKENVFKVSSPRTDIKVQVDGWSMPPFMGLASYAAFTPATGGKVMVMGDTVLLQDEVNPAMTAALEAGLEVTALHKHFFFDEPKVYFMHIGGMGDTQELAQAVRKVWDKVKDVRAASAQPAAGFGGQPLPAQSSISAKALQGILGTEGQASNGMFKAVFGRSAQMHGVKFGNEMGLNTWAAFAGSDDNAVVDGDFAMLESELQGVLKALRAAHINVVAIHSHMTHEEPRIMFLHYWGKGTAEELARGIKAARATQK